MTEMIQSAPLQVFLAMLAFPVVIAGVGVFVSVRSARLARIIERTPTAALGSATPGYVELEGRAEVLGATPLRSPLTDAPVCWYRAKVEEWVSSRSDSPDPTWRTLTDHTSREPFLLRDPSGVCAVYPDGADVTPTDRSVWYGATPEPEDQNPPRVGPGEPAEGMVRISGTPGRRYRYTEERLYAGDPLYALGELRIRAGNHDDPDDELIDEEETDERSASLGRRAAAVSPHRLVKPPTGRQPYLISTTPQHELREAHQTGSRAALTIVALGAALEGLLLWARFGP